MAKGGRPMIADMVRYACGKINKAESDKLAAAIKKTDDGKDKAPASPRVGAVRDMFNARCFKGGRQAQHAGDAIGQLWLTGKLDVRGMDETRLLAATRCWWNGREEVLKDVASKPAKFERASRSSSSSAAPNKRERDYYRYEAFLRDANDYDYDMLKDLMDVSLEGHPPYWVARIIQTEVLRYFILPLVELACASDYDKLEAAKRAMIAMAGSEAVEALKKQAA